MAGILPPVSGDITLDNAAAMGAIAETKTGLADLSASTDAMAESSAASTDAAVGLGAAGTAAARDTESAMDDAAAATAGVGTAARDAADDTKTAAEDAAGGLGGIGVAAKDAEADTTDAMHDSSTAVKDLGTAAEDAGSKTEMALADAGGAASNLGSKTKTAAEDGSSAFTKMGGVITLAAVGVSAVAIKMATDFQKSMTLLETGAGQAASGIGAVKSGILGMAGAVGQTPEALAQGMYLIESAGYKGAAGLDVLKASAEGASVGNANMATVADAVTTALTDYHLKASDAASVTSALVETVASGKTNLDALAGSLGKVMPTAAALGLSFQDVTGAMATMTNAGLSARFAASHLQNTLLALSAPSTTASAALASVGLTSQQVKDALDGPGGIKAALGMVTTAVGSTFPAGSVAGVTAMKAIMGGATGYSTALMLGGKSAQEFADNVKNIGGVLNSGTQQVQGFNKVQGDLKFQLDSAKASAESLGIEFGDALLPKLEELLHDVMDVVTWFEHNKDAATALAVVVGGVLSAAVGVFAVNKIGSLISSTKDAITSLEAVGSKAITAAGNFLGFGTNAETAAGEVESSQGEIASSATTTAGDVKTSSAELSAALDSAAEQIQAAAEQISTALASIGAAATEAEGTTDSAVEGMAASVDTTISGMEADFAVMRGELETPIVVPPVTGGAVSPASTAEEAGAGAAVGEGEVVAGGAVAGGAAADVEAGGLGGALTAVALPAAIGAAVGLALHPELEKIANNTHGLAHDAASAGSTATTLGGPQKLLSDSLGWLESHLPGGTTGPPKASAEQQTLMLIHSDMAKTGDIKQLQSNVQNMSTIFGAGSTQANNARAQLLAAELKFAGVAGKDSSLHDVSQKIAALQTAENSNSAKASALIAEKLTLVAHDGTVSDLKTAIADEKTTLHSDLAAGNTAGAANAQKQINTFTNELDKLQQLQAKITQREDTQKLDADLLSQEQTLHADLQSQTKKLDDVTITRFPKLLASGTLNARIVS